MTRSLRRLGHQKHLLRVELQELDAGGYVATAYGVHPCPPPRCSDVLYHAYGGGTTAGRALFDALRELKQAEREWRESERRLEHITDYWWSNLGRGQLRRVQERS